MKVKRMTVILDDAFMETLAFILSHDFEEKEVAQHLIEQHTVKGGLKIALHCLDVFTQERSVQYYNYWSQILKILNDHNV